MCVWADPGLDGVSAIALATDGISEPGIGVDIPEFTIGECVSIAGRALSTVACHRLEDASR
jgi:hypothetical protein